MDFLKKGSRSFHVSKSLRSSPFIVSSDRPSITNTADGLSVPELVWSNLHLKENRIALVRDAISRKMDELFLNKMKMSVYFRNAHSLVKSLLTVTFINKAEALPPH